MHFEGQKPVAVVLNSLFEQYRKHVAEVDRITKALVEQSVVGSQQDIVNDHIAFRTLGVPNLGIASLEKIFLAYGYQKKDYYYFAEKKLDAYWYAPEDPSFPRIFVSELRVKDLSAEAQAIIHSYTDAVVADPVDRLDLENGAAVGAFLQEALWPLPSLEDYQRLLEESEYAAWVIYNRYYLNHYTVSIHTLPEGYNTLEEFNAFVEGLGIKLNNAGGTIKTSDDGLLRQSSTISALYTATFAEGKQLPIAGSYVEFAERRVLPEFKDLPAAAILPHHRRDGFEANNADKIFESTYTSQIKNS